MTFSIGTLGDCVTVTLDIEYSQPIYVALMSDLHIDSTHCDRKLLKRHIKEVQQRKAVTFFGGDVFDITTGRNDPRRSNKAIQDNSDEVTDTALKLSHDLLKPLYPLIGGIGIGNHEQSAITHLGTNLGKRLLYRVNEVNKECQYLGYTKYIIFNLRYKKTKKVGRYVMRYHHGSKSGGEVTGNAIHVKRRAVWLDADIVWSGHTHRPSLDIVKRELVTTKGKVKERNQWHVVTAGYHGMNEWAKAKEFPPQPRGMAWLRFDYDTDNMNYARMQVIQDVE